MGHLTPRDAYYVLPVITRMISLRRDMSCHYTGTDDRQSHLRIVPGPSLLRRKRFDLRAESGLGRPKNLSVRELSLERVEEIFSLSLVDPDPGLWAKDEVIDARGQGTWTASPAGWVASATIASTADTLVESQGLDIGPTKAGHHLDYLHQKAYILKILRRFGLSNCHPCATPYNDKDVLQDYAGSASKDDILLYQEMIGSLTWLMLGTRPDIAYAVSKLARFARNPSPEHFVAAKRVFRYLRGTLSLALFYPCTLGELNGYVDADWAGPRSIKSISTSGYLFLLGNSPISWCSKRQTSVALSSTESEYIAMSLAAQEAIWLHLLLSELSVLDAVQWQIKKESHLRSLCLVLLALLSAADTHASEQLRRPLNIKSLLQRSLM
ncbi:hypothetical protein CNMCM5793_003882 [Aspergillus hiratsukae]|nr:hypothetical protein CNMCM5793_003882 [Aspergillus hiratsukae]